MTEEMLKKFQKLLNKGNSFTKYDCIKFSVLGGRKWTPSIEYQTWKIEVENLIKSEFGFNSSIYHYFYAGDEALEFDEDFNKGHGYILGSLNAAINDYKISIPSKKDINNKKEISAKEIPEIEKPEITLSKKNFLLFMDMMKILRINLKYSFLKLV